jgi:iron-sulfur cluster assembly protein/iron-sulfur cluster insertion protein
VSTQGSTTEAAAGVTLTPRAVARIAQIRDAEGYTDMALRLSIRPGGCSGFSYDLKFDSQIDEHDMVSEYDAGVRLVVDPQSLEMLRGASVDFEDGLMGQGFAVSNPSASRSCGCGQSFC